MNEPQPFDLRQLSSEEKKRYGRGFSHDMSPDAVSRRLEIVSQLYELAQLLGRAKPVAEANGDRTGVSNETEREV